MGTDRVDIVVAPTYKIAEAFIRAARFPHRYVICVENMNRSRGIEPSCAWIVNKHNLTARMFDECYCMLRAQQHRYGFSIIEIAEF